MIFETKPHNFNPAIHVVACYLLHDDTFVLLHRQPHKKVGNVWGLPAGKVDPGEQKEAAVLREVFEETGVGLNETDLEYYDTLFVRTDSFEIEYSSFAVRFSERPDILLREDEHQDFRWVTPCEALAMDKVHDMDECITRHFLV